MYNGHSKFSRYYDDVWSYVSENFGDRSQGIQIDKNTAVTHLHDTVAIPITMIIIYVVQIKSREGTVTPDFITQMVQTNNDNHSKLAHCKCNSDVLGIFYFEHFKKYDFETFSHNPNSDDFQVLNLREIMI